MVKRNAVVTDGGEILTEDRLTRYVANARNPEIGVPARYSRSPEMESG